MGTVETYSADIPDWATSIEFVVNEPNRQMDLGELTIESHPDPLFLVAVVSTLNGFTPPFLDAQLQIRNPSSLLKIVPQDEESIYVSSDFRLIIINNPDVGRWEVAAKGGIIPFALNAMVFHPATAAVPPTPPAPASPSPITVKCRACKITAKALALSIVAAATLPAVPAALLTAVAAYLGVTVVIAAAFVSSVVGDTADVIAEKLCKSVGLC